MYFFDGKFVKPEKAHISVEDVGFQSGYGVFDVLRTYGGKPYKLDDHLSRLLGSAKYANMDHPYEHEYIRQAVLRAIEKNLFCNAIVKIIISGGESKDMMLYSDKTHIIVLVKEFNPPSLDLYKKGAKAVMFPVKRFAPHIKSINYLPAVMGHFEAKKRGAAEALYVEDGYVTEGAISNLFIVKNGVLMTPKDGMLAGITRKSVLSLAKKIMPMQLGPITPKEVFSASEAFLTSTTKEIMPVVNIDGKKIGNGKPGYYTDILADLFKKTTV